MKKYISILTAFLIMMVLASCGEVKDNKPSSDIESQVNSMESSQSNSTKSIDTTELLSYTFKVPGKSIYVDVPNYQEIERGFTQLYILNGKRYVAVTFDLNTSVSSLKEAHEIAFNKFNETIQDYSYVNSLDVSDSKEETINGIKTYRFVGKLNCALDYYNRNNSYDAYAIGYSFIMDGTPCSIIGSIIDQEQTASDVNEITEIVDAMIRTLRSER